MQRSVYILIMLLFVGNYAAWGNPVNFASTRYGLTFRSHTCLLYTSDAADE